MIRYTKDYWDDIAEVCDKIPGLEKLFGKTFFITGGTGMICSVVAELLFFLNQERNAEIRIILAGRNKERVEERFKGLPTEAGFNFFQYDATKSIMLDVDFDVDYIIHGAGNADPMMYAKQPVETMLGNLFGLDSLLRLAALKRAKRLLYVSSSEVYGNKPEFRPYIETDYGFVDILNPRAGYPCAKRAAEALCIAYGQEYGIDTAIVRPGHIYGPSITESDSRASAQFSRSAVKREHIVMKSRGSQLRSYCYTLDCASAMLAVLLNGESGSAYNISNRDSIVSIRDVAEAFAKEADIRVYFEEASVLEKSGYNLMENSALDSTKLEMLGWSGSFDLERGTKSTLRFLEL